VLGCNVKLLPPNLVAIRGQLNLEELGCQENCTRSNVVGLKLQAK